MTILSLGLDTVIIKMLGVWLFSDAQVSLAMYLNKPGQTWLKDHSIRVIRMIIAIVLMLA